MLRLSGVHVLLATCAAVALWCARRWRVLEHGRGALGRLRSTDLLVGFGTNFFATVGIGAFAPTIAIFKLQRRDRRRICGGVDVAVGWQARG